MGSSLKYAGYDALALVNAADSPVYVKVKDDHMEVCDAYHLWGKDLYETTDWLWDNLGTDWSVLAIGQAGENRVRFATALIDKVATLGKGGLGAVLGSKMVKAVAVKGTKGLRVADPKSLRRYVFPLLRDIARVPSSTHELIELGKTAVWDQRAGNFLYRNYAAVFPPDQVKERFGKEVYLSNARKGRVACLGCPKNEKELIEIRDGTFAGLVCVISNWPGRIRDWGVRLDLNSHGEAVKCIELASRYGLCSHIASYMIELAIDLHSKGIIPKQDLQGTELELGSPTAVELIRQMAAREGLGDTLAEGVWGLVSRYWEEVTSPTSAVRNLEGRSPRYDFGTTFRASSCAGGGVTRASGAALLGPWWAERYTACG